MELKLTIHTTLWELIETVSAIASTEDEVTDLVTLLLSNSKVKWLGRNEPPAGCRRTSSSVSDYLAVS